MSERNKCPKCGCPAYTKQGQEYAKYKGQEEPVLKFRRKCKYCGCKYTVNVKERENPKCPHCGSLKTRKNGFAKNGVRIYRCSECSKYFQSQYLKGEPPSISEYKKTKIQLYLKGGFSDRFIAKMFNVGATSVARIRRKVVNGR